MNACIIRTLHVVPIAGARWSLQLLFARKSPACALMQHVASALVLASRFIRTSEMPWVTVLSRAFKKNIIGLLT
jgi:hypothetical protein